jgi:hypothetical protein
MSHAMQTRGQVVMKAGLGLWAAVSLGLSLCVWGCATQDRSLANLPVQEYTGYYTDGENQSWFHASDSVPGAAPMWVTFTGKAVDQVEKARGSGQLLPGQRYFVRWKAAVTTGGEIGPRGQGAPALLVRELLEIRSATAADGVKP